MSDTCWEDVVEFVVSEGLEHVVGLPGDDLEAVAAFEGSPVVPHWVRDQRVAVGMAAGAALTGGRPTVCVVGRGPGAAAAVPWTLEAQSAGAPVLVISGGVPVGTEGGAPFQDAPLVELFKPVTKRSVRVTEPRSVIPELVRSSAIAMTGAPGPVFIELPDGLGSGGRPRSHFMSIVSSPTSAPVSDLMAKASRPVLLVGGGCSPAQAPLLESLAERWSAPIFCSASGRGVVNERHCNFLGLAGLYARGLSRKVLSEADLVISVGSRLEETVTMGWAEDLPVVQVTTEPAHLAVHRRGVGVVASASQTLEAWQRASSMGPVSEPAAEAARRDSMAAARAEGERWAQTAARAEASAGEVVAVARVMRALSGLLPEGSVVVHENGLADIWAYHFPVLVVPPGGMDLCPSEQTTLGFGVAAALGASMVHPDRMVVAIVGDGAMNAVAGDARAFGDSSRRVLWIVLDNGGFGWLQAFCGADREGLFASERERFSLPQRVGAVEVKPASRSEPIERDLARALHQVESGESLIFVVPVSLSDEPPAASDPPTGA